MSLAEVYTLQTALASSEIGGDFGFSCKEVAGLVQCIVEEYTQVVKTLHHHNVGALDLYRYMR